MIIARAPFRISFFGGGSDLPEHYREHGGACLATSIDQYCYLSVHELSPFFRYKYRASYARTECVEHISEFQHPLIRETLNFCEVDQGLEISHVSDLPGRTGLGTSSSFTVALLQVLYARKGLCPPAEQLAEEAIQIERTLVGDSGGHQDQYAAACGGLMKLVFPKKGPTQVLRPNVAPEHLLELRNHLQLFYMGLEQSAEAIMADQKKRVPTNVETLNTMTSMVDIALDALAGGKLRDFGSLLHESWMLKRSLSSGISTTDIDEAYSTARSHGAWGGKLLGAGGRGFLLVCSEPEKHAGIAQALSHLRPVDFSFTNEGSRVIFNSQAGEPS